MDADQKQERKEKQKYLRQEIILKGYSPDEFTSFCEKYKNPDLDLWTLEELEEVVNEFKKSHSNEHPKPDSEEEEVSNEEVMIESGQHEEPKIEGFSCEIEEVKGPNTYQVNTAVPPETELSAVEHPVAKIEEHELNDSGLFGKHRVWFHVRTTPLGWNVKRTLQDFNWLQEVLTAMFPATYVPPKPPKLQKVRAQNEQKVLERQGKYLQQFISAVMRNALFRRSPYLEGFLSMRNDTEFRMLKKQGYKDKPHPKIEERWSISGQVNCDPDIDTEMESQLKEFIYNTENLKSNFKRKVDLLVKKLREVAGLTYAVAQTMETIEEVHQSIPNIKGYQTLYSSLSRALKQMARHEQKKSKVMKDYCSVFFKFGYNELGPLLSIIKERDSLAPTFQKTEQKLLNEKEKLWTNKDPKNWKMAPDNEVSNQELLNNQELAFSKMLHKKTEKFNELKNEFCYYNFQVKAETKRVLLDNQLVENMHFTDFGNMEIDLFGTMTEAWQSLVDNLAKIRSECRVVQE